MPATTWHGSGYDDNYYVAPAPSSGSSAGLLYLPHSHPHPVLRPVILPAFDSALATFDD